MSVTFKWDGNIDITNGDFIKDGTPISSGSSTYTKEEIDNKLASMSEPNSIEKIEFVGDLQPGLPGTLDPYRITLTDGTVSEFFVQNGFDGANVDRVDWLYSDLGTSEPGMPGAKDTYQIGLSNGESFEFFVYNGKDAESASLDRLDVMVTVSQDGEDTEKDVYSQPMYRTISYAISEAIHQGARNILVKLEGNIEEPSLDFYYGYNYLKIYRDPDQVDPSITTILSINNLEIWGGANVIIDDPCLTELNIMSTSNTSLVHEFGKLEITGGSSEDTKIYIVGELNVDTGHLILNNCKLNVEPDAKINFTNGGRGTFINYAWDQDSTRTPFITVTNGAILTGTQSDFNFQEMIESKGNSGLVIWNNQLLPH